MNEYLEFAKRLADEAGEIMLRHFQVGVLSQAKAHEGDTPVTIADREINRLVIEAVQAKYPSHAVIGEEESHVVTGAEFTWVCDPVDGTIPYTMGIPTNVFSLALVNGEGRPVVAVVEDPYMKRRYWAVLGQGAFVNGAPLHVNQIHELKKAYVAGSGIRSEVIRTAALRGATIAQCYRTFTTNCIIYEAMLVASGQIAATIYPGSGAHDVATSALIIEEAGGRVTNLLGEDQRYDKAITGAIISNGAIHEKLLALTRQYLLN